MMIAIISGRLVEKVWRRRRAGSGLIKSKKVVEELISAVGNGKYHA
jgi:hypothetical protein